MTDDVTTDLPARPRAAERYTEGMNRWFQESLQNNRPWVDTLVAAGIAQAFADGSPHLHGLLSAIGKVYADERRQRQKEIEGLRKEVAALEQRLLERPGKLPVAKTWKPETVFYANEVVTHDGALWQARKDTATRPGGADWVCVARAGRDAITPNVCGTFSADETYRQLDIVMHDGAAWIARCDDPGICPGDGWQLMSKQGRRGRPGDRGPPGDRGDPGQPGASVVSWQLDRAQYRVSPLMSNGTVGPMLDLHALAQQIVDDVGRYYGWDRE